MAIDIGPKIGIDGEAEFRKELNNVNTALKTFGTEMKKVTSELGENKESQEALLKQNEVLNKTIDTQKRKLEMVEKALEKARDKYGENATETLKWQQVLNNTETELNRLENELGQNEKALGEMEQGLRDVETGLKKVDDAAEKIDLEEMKKQFKDATEEGIKIMSGALTGLSTAFLATAEATREYRTDQGKLKAAYETTGHSAETAKEAFQEIYSILGEDDTSVEAANHLAVLTQNEEDLAKWTGTILPGVFAQFGDSLPLEGLTEAANETVKVGQVTGPLADALNWAGISEDKFNESLAKCTTEQERQRLITDTLTKTYKNVSDAYKENNKDIINANKAQARLTDATARLGAVAEPIMTKLKNMLADIVEAIADAVEEFNKLPDGAQKVILAIGGIGAAAGPTITVYKKMKNGVGLLKNAFKALKSPVAGATAATAANTAATITNTTATVAGTTATTGATGAFAAFNAVLKANPIMAVIGAIGLLVGAFALFDSAVKNSNSESAKFRRELEQANETMEDYQESMSEIKTRQDETIAEGTAEISHYQQLKAELDGLIDKNGKVKKGYEERAQFIATTLNDSLGTEIKMTDGVISGYEEVSESIDKLIEKKKAQIIMDAREEEYTKAIKEQNNLIDAAATKYEALSRAQEEYQRDYEKLDGRQRQIRESNLKTLEADYKQAANLVKENSDTIKGYEGDMAEFLKGNYNEISYSAKTTYSNIDKLSREEAQKEIKTLRDKAAELRNLAAETGDQAIAQRAADYEAEALQLQKHLDNLGDTVESDTQVTSAAKKLGNESAYQFEEGFDGKNLGQAAIEGIASGMSTSKSALTNATASAVNTLTSAFRNKLKINSPSKLMRDKVGKSITEGIAVGMEEEIPILAKANSEIVKTVSGIRMGTVSADMANKNNSSSVLNSIPTNIGENKVINNVIYNVLDGKIISKTVQNDITKNQMAVMRMKGALI